MFVFGRNKYGELGLGHSSAQTVTIPTPIHSLSGIVKVACGLYHSAAIDGELHKTIVLKRNDTFYSFIDDGNLWM